MKGGLKLFTLITQDVKLENPMYYNNREISWLDFNERVLEEAMDYRNPPLERLKFLAIFSSNLDEFFMDRVAGLENQVKEGFNKPENKTGLTPTQQLHKIALKTHRLVDKQYDTFNKVIIPKLLEEDIEFLNIDSLTLEQEKEIRDYFDEQIFPVLTPMAVDAYRPFPLLLNRSLNLAVVLENNSREEEGQLKIAIVQVPAVLDRFVRLNSSKKIQIIYLEDIISKYIDKLFKGYKVLSISVFRITRNADLSIHKVGECDFLREIEKELKNRKWGAAVRLEIQKKGFDHKVLHYLMEELELLNKDVYEIDGSLDLTVFLKFYQKMKESFDHLVYENFIPQTLFGLSPEADIFNKILKQDILLHHPYESFKQVGDFISKAADDPNVLSIKQTLYRISGDSPIIQALKRAVRNGKQVTVLVELRARFDEDNNVQWAKELEKAGCGVFYGMNHLITHCKITLVERKRNHHIERYVQIGTGNYNDQTAEFYTDFSLFTSKRKAGMDAANLFNFLCGSLEKPEYNHFSIAPFDIRNDLMRLINEEIKFQKRFSNGRIIVQTNALTDRAIIMKLYEASIAGVKIDLIVRGVCCLRPGIKGVSENIRVRSIVGRFLEHSRIYYFHHNGEEKTYLSSADLMTANMEKGVELLYPICDGNLKIRLKRILACLLTDNVKAREQDENGLYRYVLSGIDGPEIHSQLLMLNSYLNNKHRK